MAKYIIKKDGVEIARVEDEDGATPDQMPNAVFKWLLWHQGGSVSYATRWGGYTWQGKGGD